MDISRLCVSCFNEKGGGEGCQYCGYIDGAPADNELHLSPGTVLKGQYLVGRVLGCGGFGVTYLAYDLNLQSVRAIKEYLPGELSSRSTDGATVYSYSGEAAENYAYGLEKFIEEGRLLAKFSSIEVIVSVFDYFRENNTAYLVMEYLDGMDLANYLRQKGGRITWTEASNIFAPIMHALAKVHVTGLIHRDIAPDNIYITNDGKVKLLDFGAARQAIGEKSQSLSVILKPGYAPPEQYHSRGSQGPWTDVYALGATIYRSLTGITPTESLTRVMNDDLRPLSELGIDIPKNAEMALSQSLNLDENARFKDMETFYDSLFEGVQAPKVKQKAALIGGGESFSQKAKTVIFKPLVIKITAAVLSVALICTLLLAVVRPLINYNTAMKLFEVGEYEQAGDGFRDLGSYKDSVMLLARSLYKEGESYYENGDFENAAEPFEELAGYYPEVDVLVTDADYMDGVAEGVDGDFDNAIDALEEVGDYENAETLIEAAEQENIQPFVDEALEHELPITEVEVIETVAEYEDYSEDVVAQHKDDAQGNENPATESENNLSEILVQENEDLESGNSNAEWLIEAACDIEGVDTIEEILLLYGLDGEVISIAFEYGEYAFNTGGIREAEVWQSILIETDNEDAYGYNEIVEISVPEDKLEEVKSVYQSGIPDDYFDQLDVKDTTYNQGIYYQLQPPKGENIYFNTETSEFKLEAPVYYIGFYDAFINSGDIFLQNYPRVISSDGWISESINELGATVCTGIYQGGVVSVSAAIFASDAMGIIAYQPKTDVEENTSMLEAAEKPNPFDFETLSVGDYVAGMVVEAIRGEILEFSGVVEVTGTYSHYAGYDEMYNEYIERMYFQPDEPSISLFPCSTTDTRSPGMEVANYEEVKRQFGEANTNGTVKMVINYYYYNLGMNDIPNYVNVISAEINR